MAAPPAIPGARPSTGRAVRVLLGSRVRAQAGYRASFGLDVVASAAVGAVEFAEVYVIFHNVPVLGGLDLPAATLVYALTHLAFGLADMVAGNLDRLPQHVRAGTLDVLMLRPLPVLVQLLAEDLQLRRLGRAAVGVVLAAVALSQLDVAWTPGTAALLVLTPLAGAAVFVALFLLAGAAQFWLVDGAEFTSAFTYGSSYAASFSPAVLPLPLRVFFTFVLPATFVAYLPTVTLLGLPGPAGLPAGLGWYLPVAAVAVCAVALLAWRAGIRRYTGAGG